MVWIFLYLAGRDAGMNIFTFIIFIFMTNSMLKERKILALSLRQGFSSIS